MPSYVMLFFITRDLPHRVYRLNYTIEQVELYSKYKARSSLQGFVNFLSKPNSISYVVFVCVVLVIGVFGEYV